MKSYYFTVVVAGHGETPEEAYLQAVKALGEDPGLPDLETMVEFDEEEDQDGVN